MKAIKEIPIYLNQKRNVRQIDVVQYDTGIQLIFTVSDFSIPSGATATLYAQKPSGKFVFQEDGITIPGNKITVDLENQAITEHGRVPYQISLNSGIDVITTFTGLIMVEKSLKDAGATEPQTTESRTVVRAFDDAVSAHVAEFQAKAEQIVQACIATIPADYSSLEARVRESANAVKGYLSGAVVSADDVSPVDHSPIVKVHGKNLIVYPYAEAKITRDGITWTIEADNGIVANGTAVQHTSFNISLAAQKNIPLKKGREYTFSCASNLTGATGYVCLQNMVNGVVSNSITVRNESATFTPTEDGFAVICAVVLSGKTFANEKLLIQLEEEAVATEYAPYIDPSTVTVTRYGADATDRSQNYIPNADGTVPGITSLSPNMTILTDTEGVIVECEYNRDTNKVIEKLINAITALGGTI